MCLVLGGIAVAAVVWLWSLNLPDFNPPGWVRILGVVWLATGVAGAALTGILGRRGPGRVKVVIGLSLAAFAVGASVALIVMAVH